MDADLHALLRARALVAVANPANGSSWTGHVIALHDDPGIDIEQEGGRVICLPQAFVVRERPEQVTVSRDDLRAVLGHIRHDRPDLDDAVARLFEAAGQPL